MPKPVDNETDDTSPTNAIALRVFVTQALRSNTVLAAFSAALKARAADEPLAPKLQTRINDVLDAHGINAAMDGMSAVESQQLLAEIRFHTLLDAKIFHHAVRPPEWNHTETEILQAGGQVSAAFADALTHQIAPRLDGLESRLRSKGGAFLDVGVGVAGLSVRMAQLWPSLAVTGIDPWEPSLALARENVRSARLAERIQLRAQTAEALTDTNAFDLVWLPSAFIPEEAIPPACARIHRALRPGGWLLFATANPGPDPVTASLVRLRTVLWGGSLTPSDQIETLLRETGFTDIQAIPSPPGSIIALIAARKSPAQ